MFQRTILLYFVMGIPAASAQALECRYIAAKDERLACYDKLTPPLPRQKESAPTAGAKGLIDESANEDARMRKALRPICKNC